MNEIGQRERVNRTGSEFSAPDPTNAQHASVLNWSYDALGQLAKADYSDNTLDQSYAYDQIGNRLSKTQTTASAQYTSNALNQFMSKTANGTTENYTYDADGNLLSDGEQTYTWDGENRLRSSTNSLTSITFHYDYLSRRIAKTTTSIPSDPWIPVLKPYNTVYAYDGWNLILEKKIVDEPYDGIKYTWGIDLSGSLQGAGGVGGLLSVTENNQTYYPTYDGNGNVSEYLDRTSNIVAHYEFDAFGNTIDSKTSGAKANNFAHRFSTKPLDSETGFYYYGYRYYNPVDGTWPSRDPIEERGGTSLYGMVSNNTINHWDYLGLKKTVCDCTSISSYDVTIKGFWNPKTYYKPLEKNGSINLSDKVGKLEVSVEWDFPDTDKECCLLKKANPAPSVLLEGNFTGSSGNCKPINPTLGRDFLRMAPRGCSPVTKRSWWDGGDYVRRPDRYWPRADRVGTYEFSYSYGNKKCDSITVTIFKEIP